MKPGGSRLGCSGKEHTQKALTLPNKASLMAKVSSHHLPGWTKPLCAADFLSPLAPLKETVSLVWKSARESIFVDRVSFLARRVGLGGEFCPSSMWHSAEAAATVCTVETERQQKVSFH